ncbi:MAG TPA: hypothetical protein VFJ16_11630 [Longimicrobium sp.]|nr:hypothetical protein [Longimicrobium sp.]
MPLTTATPPEGGIRAVRNAIRHVLRHPGSALKTLAAAAGEGADVCISVPHPVYTLGLPDVAGGNLADSALLQGWRYLLTAGDTLVAAAEVIVSGTRAVRFSHFNDSPFVRSTVDALAAAEALNQVAPHDYEVRLLKVPALYLFALWLHGPDELYLPLAPAPPEVTALCPYSQAELAAALRAKADERLAFDARPEPAPPR